MEKIKVILTLTPDELEAVLETLKQLPTSTQKDQEVPKVQVTATSPSAGFKRSVPEQIEVPKSPKAGIKMPSFGRTKEQITTFIEKEKKSFDKLTEEQHLRKQRQEKKAAKEAQAKAEAEAKALAETKAMEEVTKIATASKASATEVKKPIWLL